MVQYLFGTAEESLRTPFFSSFQLPHSPKFTSAGPIRPSPKSTLLWVEQLSEEPIPSAGCSKKSVQLAASCPCRSSTLCLLMIFCQLIIDLSPLYFRKNNEKGKGSINFPAYCSYCCISTSSQIEGWFAC